MSDTMARSPGSHRGRPDGFGGEVIRPGDPAYDGARSVFNAMIDKRPGVIAQCESAADVAAAVRYGVSEGLEIAVRGEATALPARG